MKKAPASIEDYLEIGRRRKWWLVIPFVFITLGVFFGSLWLPRQYRSEATIMIEPQKVPANYVQPTIATDITDRLQAIRQEILSRTRLRKIIGDLGLYHTVPGAMISDTVVETMRNDISVEVVNNQLASDRNKSVAAFRISYVGSDPVLVQKVTRNLASLFIEENLKDREQESEGTADFLDGQLERMRQSLQEQESRIQAFKTAHAGELPEQQNASFQMLGQLQTVLQTNSDAITRAQQQQAFLSTVSNSAKLNTMPQNLKSALQLQLDTKNAELVHAEQKYKDNHPDILRLKDEIGALKRQIDSDKVNNSNDSSELANAEQIKVQIRELNREIENRVARQKEIERKIQVLQSRMGQLPLVEQQLAELTRDYETSQTSYQGLLAKRNNSSVAAEMERRAQGEQFRILDPASYPDRPYKPNLMRIDVVGLLVGLFVGCGLALLVELTDTTMNRPVDLLDCTGLPVLGCLLHMKDAAETKRQSIYRWAILAVMMTMVAGTLLLAYWQRSSIATGFGWKL